MSIPGSNLAFPLALGQTPDATPVVRVFRNGVRTTTATVVLDTGLNYTVTYTIPSGWATTDYVQLIGYVLFGGTQFTTEVFGGRLGSILLASDSVATALILDQAPDSTPTIAVSLDGEIDGAVVTTITATAFTNEYTVTITIPSTWVNAGNAEAIATATILGGLYPADLWPNSGLAITAESNVSSFTGLAGTWRCPPASEPVDAGQLQKNAADSRRYAFDLGDIEEIVSGQTIVTATITAVTTTGSGTVTVAGTTIGTYQIAATLSGGDSGSVVTVTLVVTFSGGGTLSRSGTLYLS
jgi:hypothetical protein